MNKHRARAEAEEARTRRIVYEHGRSLVFVGLFVLCAIGQPVMGQRQEHEDREAHGKPRLSDARYLGTGHCLEAVA